MGFFDKMREKIWQVKFSQIPFLSAGPKIEQEPVEISEKPTKQDKLDETLGEILDENIYKVLRSRVVPFAVSKSKRAFIKVLKSVGQI